METPEQGVKSVHKKDTRTTSKTPVVFIVNFERFRSLIWCFCCYFKQVNPGWETATKRKTSPKNNYKKAFQKKYMETDPDAEKVTVLSCTSVYKTGNKTKKVLKFF